MTLTNTEAVTDLSILESLDFEATLGCEGITAPLDGGDLRCPFDAEAELLIAVHVSGNRYTVCRECWAGAGKLEILCPHVDAFEWRDDHYSIVRVLR